MWVTTDCGQRHKLQDLICWNFLESRRCVKHAELLQSRGLQAVIVPIPPKHSRQPKHIVAQLAAGHDDLSDTTRQPDANRSVITQYAGDIHRELSNEQIPSLLDSELSVKPGAKCYKWERLGVPLRIEVGQQEIQTDTVTIVVNPGLWSAVTAGLEASNSSSCCSSKLLERYIAPAATAVGLSQKQGLRLPGVALADCVAACCELLSAAAAGAAAAADLPRTHLQQQQQQGLSSPNSNSSSGSWPCLLPNGYCNKLHLWSSSSSSSNMSSSSRPCPAHMRHLLGLGKPCFCGAAPHVTLEDLQSEITHQMTAAAAADSCSSALHFHQCESATTAAARCTQDLSASQAAVSDSGNARIANQNVADTSVGIFVSGIPKNLAAAAVRQQLQQQFQPMPGYCNAVVPAVGRKNRGWARVMMRSIVEAEQAMRELDGQLVMSPNTAALQLSWCCGRADALFPDLHYDIRRQLRIDAVAAYSMTDSSTAAAMAALLAAVAAVVKAWHRVTTAASTALCAAAACYKLGTRCDSSSSSSDLGSSSSTASGLSATDLTACAGGNVIAFMKHFSSVTAVELDPDRAEDLLHNIRVVLQPSLPLQQQQQQQPPQHRDSFCDSKNLQASASSADSDKQAQSAALDAAVVPHFAVMHSQQQQQCRRVAVVCGDAVELANHLQQQDVLFLDPPWGGPNYQQQQQQHMRCAQQSSDTSSSSSSSSSRRTGCPVQSKVQLPQSYPAAKDSSKSATNGGLDTTGLCLSGVPLQDLCSQLLQKCYILAVKLPSRWSGIDNFCKTVIQLVDDMREQHFSTEAAMQGKVGCIRARYGRSELVMFVRTPGVSETRRVDGQQQHIWIKQLRGCLKEHH